MTQTELENAVAYAVERATATRKPYVISTMGHVMWYCAGNRRVFKECDLQVLMVVKPG